MQDGLVYFGPFNNPEPSGIDRGYYMAIHADDCATAAKFAATIAVSASLLAEAQPPRPEIRTAYRFYRV